ncbi:hypothetical protein Bcep18194_C6671 [Burkholderia lata]|uniref:Uncharacterized protein n=1 Tax=Burkholderia lata (strain ATCC 17760 / DSM 23089 / LMG 22485 / NCIMB 9086 / R18194 / 383) TaxID=482957 RepID=Q39P95_BURL3|nr:hypothetical protein Bcep18194_C6671 [Burkholderia lata]
MSKLAILTGGRDLNRGASRIRVSSYAFVAEVDVVLLRSRARRAYQCNCSNCSPLQRSRPAFASTRAFSKRCKKPKPPIRRVSLGSEDSAQCAAHQTRGVMRDRIQTTFVPQSDSIGKPKSGFAAPLDEH